MKKNVLDEILRDFYTISQMDISVVDCDFRALASVRTTEMTLCSVIHRVQGSVDKCKTSDIERLTNAKNSSSPILYTCPFGISEVIAPIIRNDAVIGYIISALGVPSRSTDEVARLCINEGCDTELVKKSLSSMRKLNDDEISAYYNMIQILAEYISGDTTLIDTNESIGQLIKKYIRNNLSRKLTLKELARNLHCSTVTLTEHFKKEFGITINEYITKKRMELSEKLLISTDKPLREIASLCGFADVEYFSRTFKKHHGISPASWRRERGKVKNAN